MVTVMEARTCVRGVFRVVMFVLAGIIDCF